MNPITLINYSGNEIPCIFHFQGKSKFHYAPLFKQMSEIVIEKGKELPQFIVIATDESLSPVIKQLNASDIPYVNPYKEKFYHDWTNSMKIDYVLQSLEHLDKDIPVVIMDGYDTAIQRLDRLIPKFKELGKKVIFNATKHNYPEIYIDKCSDRENRGNFRYFNAGVCIGYQGHLIEFYKACKKELEREPVNDWNSEQYTLRHVLNDFEGRVDFDWQCKLFQSMGSTRLEPYHINDQLTMYKVV